MAFRLYLMKGQLPAFSEEDNPASFSKSIATRFMTYCYLCAFNLQLLLLPLRLSYDWQVGSIPIVESFTDIRNIQTAITFIVLAAFVIRFLAAYNHVSNYFHSHFSCLLPYRFNGKTFFSWFCH